MECSVQELLHYYHHLATTFMLVEVNKSWNAAHNISIFVHDNDSCCSQGSLGLNKPIEVHEHIVTYAAAKSTIAF